MDVSNSVRSRRRPGVLELLLAILAAAFLAGCSTSGSTVNLNANPFLPSPTPPEPPREYRAAWVATVANIDWPSRQGLSVDQLRAEMSRILDTAQSLNLNALILQVRPTADAIYISQLEPWSEYLSGTQGLPPGNDSTFDPLAEWIDGAHARGLELHAWFNPYRSRHRVAKSPDAPNHINTLRPDLAKAYDGYMWLDPGEPDARAHTLRVMLDVVERYDLDGVHVDDYFYPYPRKDEPFPDDASFAKYTAAAGQTPLSRSDWRRENINSLVRDLYTQVKSVKPWVRVGISPFGIWRPNHPTGVRGFDAYEGLAADARLWLQRGWLDYIAPQLYWRIESPQPYPQLLDWWLAQNRQGAGRLVLVGNYTSRLSEQAEADGRAWPATEILNQISRTRDRASTSHSVFGASGNIHFSMKALVNNQRDIATLLKQGPYARPALVPATPWSASGPTLPAPSVNSIDTTKPESITLTWEARTSRNQPIGQWIIWSRIGGEWSMQLAPRDSRSVTLLRAHPAGALDRVAVVPVDRFGRLGAAAILEVPATKAVTSSSTHTPVAPHAPVTLVSGEVP